MIRRPLTRRPLLGTLVAVVAGALALSSCASIPTHGAIRSNEVAAGAPTDQFIRVLARPPRVGASPAEIVSGFLTASASFEDNHAVARTYLSAAASLTWEPGSRVAVYEADPGYRLTARNETTVRMEVPVGAGEIGARGQFTQQTKNGPFHADFSLRKVDGQWRIGTVPQGLILSTADVARTYRAINLYYLDADSEVLVPDPLFLPTQQPGIATSIVRELLAGPTAWLAPAVRTAFPSGTRLAVDSVPITGGDARVDLNPGVVAATAADRAGLSAQLTYTLAQLPDVSGVRITVNGVPFSAPGVGAVNRVADWAAFDPEVAPTDPNTYAVDGGHLAVVQETSRPASGYFGAMKGLTAAAVAPDGQLVAGLAHEGARSVVRMGAAQSPQASVVYRGAKVTSLSFDRFNDLWIADEVGGRSQLWLARWGRAAVRVPVDGLGNGTIEQVRVARDGARVALVVSGTLFMGRVQRTGDVPEVAALLRLENQLSDVVDVGWANDSMLLVVGRQAGEALQGYTVGIDGDQVARAGAVPDLRTVAACPGRPFLAGTSRRRSCGPTAGTGGGRRPLAASPSIPVDRPPLTGGCAPRVQRVPRVQRRRGGPVEK